MILALDIGGSTTKWSLGTCQASATPQHSVRATEYSYDQFLLWLRSVATSEPGFITSVGVSFGVAFSQDGRVVEAAGKMADFEGRHIAVDLESIFECPVRLAHDCICALL